jgi:hypothetical protein
MKKYALFVLNFVKRKTLEVHRKKICCIFAQNFESVFVEFVLKRVER